LQIDKKRKKRLRPDGWLEAVERSVMAEQTSFSEPHCEWNKGADNTWQLCSSLPRAS